MEPLLAATAIQGNVLPGFNTRHMHLLGLKIPDEPRARAWLAELQDDVAASDVRALAAARQERREARSGSRDPKGAARTWVNVVLSYRGLRLLAGPTAEEVADPWFRNGMWAVAGPLGDGPIERWSVGSSEATTPDILVVLGHDNRDRLAETLASLKARGLPVVFEHSGDRLAGNVEHFGFRDGVSLPAIRGRLAPGEYLDPRYLTADDLFSRPGRVLIWPGQAVFGYPQQSATDLREPGPIARGGPAWMENGSFFMLRRFEQHVDRFEAFVARRSQEVGLTPELLAERMVGRRRDGTPLSEVPRPGLDNHFLYRSPTPPVGEIEPVDPPACPLTAHIRKVNPRDATTDRGGPAMTLKLQVLRRGIPFGTAESAERGLLFMAYTTRLREPLETLGAGWMNRSDAPEARAGGPDALVGQAAHQTWITPRGGGFFFSPSIPVLAQLAAGPLD